MKTKTTLAIAFLAICILAAIPAAVAQDPNQPQPSASANESSKLNPKLAARAQELLPGKDPQEAYTGFKSPTDFW